jgi:DNA repair ATPase RecN
MKRAMKLLFDELRRAMQGATSQSESARKLVRAIYQRFQNELGFVSTQPQPFSTMKYRVELELLYKESESYRNNPMLALSEQTFVVKKFFRIMVARARDIFSTLNQAQDDWLGQVLTPLVSQIQEHKDMMEKRLINLQKIGRSKNTLQVRIEDLESQYAELARQLTALRNLFNSIHLSRPDSDSERPRPRLVVAGGNSTTN